MFTVSVSTVKNIPQDHPEFRIIDGYTSVPRAELTISKDCPSFCKSIIREAYKNGWIKLSANMYDYEHTMDKLKETE